MSDYEVTRWPCIAPEDDVLHLPPVGVSVEYRRRWAAAVAVAQVSDAEVRRRWADRLEFAVLAWCRDGELESAVWALLRRLGGLCDVWPIGRLLLLLCDSVPPSVQIAALQAAVHALASPVCLRSPEDAALGARAMRIAERLLERGAPNAPEARALAANAASTALALDVDGAADMVRRIDDTGLRREIDRMCLRWRIR